MYIVHVYPALEYSCNKYCDLIGHSEVSISHRDLQFFHKDLQISWRPTSTAKLGRKMHGVTVA